MNHPNADFLGTWLYRLGLFLVGVGALALLLVVYFHALAHVSIPGDTAPKHAMTAELGSAARALMSLKAITTGLLVTVAGRSLRARRRR